MIEIAENAIQLVMTGVCSGVALYRAMRSKDRAWALLGLFAGIYCLGDLYWLLYLAFYKVTPQHFSVAEMSWYTSYLFLTMLVIYVRIEICGHRMPEPGERSHWTRNVNPVLWLVPVFTAGMCVFFMQWGDYISNIFAAFLMTGIIWHALSGLLYRGAEASPKDVVQAASHMSGAENSATVQKEGRPEKSGQRMLFAVTLAFAVIEYAMWVSSCFWMGNTIANVYFWLDILLSCTFLLFVPALGKAVSR